MGELPMMYLNYFKYNKKWFCLNHLQSSKEICYSLDGLWDNGDFSLNFLPTSRSSFKDHIKLFVFSTGGV